jgi:hypothetical protein
VVDYSRFWASLGRVTGADAQDVREATTGERLMPYVVKVDSTELRIVFGPSQRTRVIYALSVAGWVVLMLLFTLEFVSFGLSARGWGWFVGFAAATALVMLRPPLRQTVIVTRDGVLTQQLWGLTRVQRAQVPLQGRRFEARHRPSFWSSSMGSASVGLADGAAVFGVGWKLTDGDVDALAADLNAYLDREGVA